MMTTTTTPDPIARPPIDSGEHVGCMVDGCGDFAAVMWVDKFHPYSILARSTDARACPTTGSSRTRCSSTTARPTSVERPGARGPTTAAIPHPGAGEGAVSQAR